ncbi:MAG: hypothetical protein ACRCUS_02220 [Anaerovoracaceae bacterium]
MGKNFFKSKILGPLTIAYLLVIMLVLIVLLNSSLANRQEENRKELEKVLPKTVLSEGTGFQVFSGEQIPGINTCYISGNAAGIATVSDVKVGTEVVEIMVGVNLNRRVSGIKILKNPYTEKPKSDIAEIEFISQFIGLTALDTKSIATSELIEPVGGAESESDAVYQGVLLALEQYNFIYPMAVENE